MSDGDGTSTDVHKLKVNIDVSTTFHQKKKIVFANFFLDLKYVIVKSTVTHCSLKDPQPLYYYIYPVTMTSAKLYLR